MERSLALRFHPARSRSLIGCRITHTISLLVEEEKVEDEKNDKAEARGESGRDKGKGG